MKRRSILLVVVLLSLLVGSDFVPARADAVLAPEVVAERLDNPRNIAFDTNGDLYIPTVGRGGTEGCGMAEVGPVCAGLSGGIVRVTAAQLASRATPVEPSVVVDRLSSIAYPSGSMALGVHGLAARDGKLFAVAIGPEFIGTANSEDCCRPGIEGELLGAARAQLGNLMQVRNGRLVTIADVDHFEFTHNPVNVPNSDPYSVAIDRDGSFVIADAAANTLVRARRDGTVSLIAAFPDIIGNGDDFSGGTEAVPDGVTIGPDGNYYVALLAGERPGLGRILQVTPAGTVRTVGRGLSELAGVAVARDGTIYASSMAGSIVRLRPDPFDTGAYLAPEYLYTGQLSFPTGIALGPDGMLYVSDSSYEPGTGRIVRLKV